MDRIAKTYILITNLTGGGAERQVSYIANIEAIDKIILIQPGVDYLIPASKLEIITKHKVSSIYGKIKQVIQIVKYFSKIKLSQNDHLICFLQFPMLVGVVLKLLFKCKLTISIRLNPFVFDELQSKKSLPLWVQYQIFKTADAVIPNSKATNHQIQNRFPRIAARVFAIENGYDVQHIIKLSQQEIPAQLKKIIEQNFCFVTAGRITYQKAYWHQIRIFSEVIKHKPNVKLLICGKGETQGQLIQLCQSLNLTVSTQENLSLLETDANIYFLGFQKNPYLIYKNANIFLFTSLFEGLPNVLIESLICNTPLVSSNCQTGPAEIMLPHQPIDQPSKKSAIKTKFGLLLPNFSGEQIFTNMELNSLEKTWLKTLLDLVNDPATIAEFKQNHHEVTNRYNLQTLIHQWQLYIEKS
jgi:glycosyltransferase involved in cell wall biosynthesis